MATLQNRIELIDGVSGVLSKIQQGAVSARRGLASMAGSRRGMEQVTAAAEGMEQVLDKIPDKIHNIGEPIPSVGNGLDNLSSKVHNTADGFARLRDLAGSTFGQMTLAGLAAGAVAKLGEAIAGLPGYLMQTSDTYAVIHARLQLVVGDGGDVEGMNQRIYESALRARGSYFQMADAVSKIAMTAKEAFPDPQTVVPFMEGIQKLFTIGGTGIQQQEDALLQLTQALGSGKLQGDEFRSIAETAPLIEQMVANYLNISQGALKQLSSDGEITADVLRDAILSNMDFINAQFEKMPLTWGNIWQLMKTQATNALVPVFDKVSKLANSPVMHLITDAAIMGVELASSALDWLMNQLLWLANTPIVQNLAAAMQGLIAMLTKAGSAIGETYRAAIAPIQKLTEEWTPRLINEMQWFVGTPIGETIVTAFVAIARAIGVALDAGAQLTGFFLETLPSAINWLSDVVILPFQLMYDAIAWACGGLNIITDIALPALLTALTLYAAGWTIANIPAAVHAAWLGILAARQTLLAAKTAICKAVTTAWAVAVMGATVASWLLHASLLAGILAVGAIIAIIAYGALYIFRKWQSVTIDLGSTIESVFRSIGEFVANAINFMVDKINGFIDVINSLAGAVNRVFGTNIGAIAHVTYKADAGEWGNSAVEKYRQLRTGVSDGIEFLKKGLGGGWFAIQDGVTGAANPGTSGSTVYSSAPEIGGDDGGAGDGGAARETADNTGRMADKLDDLADEVKDWIDTANQEAVLKYTKQEIAVSVGDINPTISEQQDIDGVIEQITEYILTGINTGAESVHI